MGLAARPGRGASRPPTTLTRRRPTAGFRDGAPDRNRWGSAVPAVHVSAARGAPGSGSCAGILKDCNIAAVAHGFRSTFRDWAAEETDHPREVIEAALAHVVGNKVEAACARPDLFERRRRLMDDWEACLPASARGCRRPPGGSNEAPACGRVGIEHEPCYHCAGTTPRRWSAVLVDGDRDALHRDRVVVPPAPVLSLLTPCQVERLACTHSRPIRPRSGLDFTRSERRLRRRGGRRPRPDLEMRSGLHAGAVKGDGPGMGGEPLPLRRRTRPA